jgi:hypothetical protein
MYKIDEEGTRCVCDTQMPPIVKKKNPLTAIYTLKLFFFFLKSRSNAKVTTSNHLFHYRSNIAKNDYMPWKGLFTMNSHMKYLSPSTYYSKDVAKVHVFNM